MSTSTVGTRATAARRVRPPALTPGLSRAQLIVLVFDEGKCGASAIVVLARTSLSSVASIWRALAETLACHAEAYVAAREAGLLLVGHCTANEPSRPGARS